MDFLDPHPRKRKGGVIQWTKPDNGTHAVSLEALSQINDQFETCPMQQMAFDSLCGELLRPQLEWVDASDNIVPDPPRISREFDLAIIAAIKGILVAGVFFWKQESASEVPEVSHPTLVWHGKKGWHAVVVNEQFPSTFRLDRINSPCQRAYASSQRLREHENLFLNRDRINSKPGIFLTVDKRMQNSDGHARPWFRTIGRDFVDTISEEINTAQSLETLVTDRAEVVKKLGEKTLGARMKPGAGKGSSDFEDADTDTQRKYHREHIVRDGYEGKPTAVLNSLVDGLQHTIKLENRVLYAMNVPPVALGRNVNSERMASAPQLVMLSIRSYKSFVERVRRAVSEMLRDVSKDKPTGAYIRFSAQLDNYDLDRLESILTPQAAADAYASTFNIPRDWVSEDALQARQGNLHGAQQTTSGHEAAIRQVKRSRGPPPQSTDTA